MGPGCGNRKCGWDTAPIRRDRAGSTCAGFFCCSSAAFAFCRLGRNTLEIEFHLERIGGSFLYQKHCKNWTVNCGGNNTISGRPPKSYAGSCGLKAGGMLKDRLGFHSVVVRSTHTLKSKPFVRFFYFSLWAANHSSYWYELWGCRSTALGLNEHTLVFGKTC